MKAWELVAYAEVSANNCLTYSEMHIDMPSITRDQGIAVNYLSSTEFSTGEAPQDKSRQYGFGEGLLLIEGESRLTTKG